jgi:DNA polymerase (family 10)
MRRCSTILSEIELITDLSQMELTEFLVNNNKELQSVSDLINSSGYERVKLTILGQYPVVIYCVEPQDFDRMHFELTGSETHLANLGYTSGQTVFSTEDELYQSKGYEYVIPEQREGLDELDSEYLRGEFVEFWHLKGVLHNHTTYSDGLNTLSEMAEFAKYEKYQYLGVCDHSKSAGYARGLSGERLIAQMKEIDQLNEKLAPFKIFKGVESDILSDGSLDYPDEVLKLLDFVVASIHSGLKMEQEKAEMRLIRAIENPYTTILGHPTGRLLLLREGYPINHQKIIDACAANDVVIELNAHPYRLDIDWTWLQYAQKKGVKISINPDAHEKSGYGDMYFGTLAARKGGLLLQNTLNALNLDEFEQFLEQRRFKKGI